LHWIKDDGYDDPSDLCAHSPVRFEIDGETLVAPADGDATVSAAAIYLLRTLDRDHTQDHPVGEQLFPCCGHAMYDTGDDDVVICGCPNGSNVDVTHVGGAIRVSTNDGRLYTEPIAEWRRAITQFSVAVRQFYEVSLPKTPADDEESAGFAKMMQEWNRRTQQT
jgi:hypothetical protein